MNSLWVKIMSVIGSLAILLYVGVQLFSWLYNPYKTEMAMYYTVEDTIAANGFVVRTEHVVKNAGVGIVDYVCEDGQRIAKDGIIANIYDNAAEASNIQKVRELDREIADLENSNGLGDHYSLDVQQVDKQIFADLCQIASADGNSSLDTIYDDKETILNLLNRKYLSTGIYENYNERIVALKEQRDTLKKGLGNNINRIYAPQSGFFFSMLDGYEGVFTPEAISKVTVDVIEKAKPAQPDVAAVGKIASDFSWFYVCVLKNEEAEKLSLGRVVDIRFPFAESNSYASKVYAKNEGKDGKTAVVLVCTNSSSELALVRNQSVKIALTNHNGLRINSKAVRIINGEKGVFIKNGEEAKFVKIEVTFTGPDYVLADPNSNVAKSGYIKPYDTILLGGDDLYDGKILK